MMLSDIRLSAVAYVGPKSRTQRPRKTKIGTEVAHVTRDSDSTFKVKRSRSLGRFAHRRVGASRGCSGGRGNDVLGVGNCCYVAVCSAAQGASAPTGVGEGRGHIVAAARLQLVEYIQQTYIYRAATINRLENQKIRLQKRTKHGSVEYTIHTHKYSGVGGV